MKLIRNLLVFLVVTVAVVFLARNAILKAAIEQGVTVVTGFKTTVAGIKYDFPSRIHIQGLEIQNPAGFNEKVFTNIPEIYVDLILPELLQGKGLHLPEVRLNLQEVHIEKNEKGVSNIELLSSVGGSQTKPSGAPAKPAPGEKKPALPFQLDKLELTIRNVSFEDRSGLLGAATVVPKKVSVDLNVNKEIFTNIADPMTLVNVIVMKIVKGATFGNLLNLDPSKLMNESLSSAMSSGQEMLNKQTAALQQQTSALLQSQTTQKAGALLDSSLQSTQGALGDTTAAAKEKLSGLFGKVKSLQSGEAATEATAS
jgi:hypothetical protein